MLILDDSNGGMSSEVGNAKSELMLGMEEKLDWSWIDGSCDIWGWSGPVESSKYLDAVRLLVDSKDVASEDMDLLDGFRSLEFSSLLFSSLDEGFRLIGDMDT